MIVSPAPDPKDILWENIALPYQQIRIRSLLSNSALFIGTIFWSSVVAGIYQISGLAFHDNATLNQYIAVLILIILLCLLPALFDLIGRYYIGFKLESEIQHFIMSKYFYYQLVNVYVTITYGSINGAQQLINSITDPSLMVYVLGTSLPTVSLFFVNLIIMKTFLAIPLEMLRFWPLLYQLGLKNKGVQRVLLGGTGREEMEREREKMRERESERDSMDVLMNTMLYGWIYPNIMMVMMILCTYAVIAPVLMPFGVLFFLCIYSMYKYQLLYVYINLYQANGHMWHSVFSFTMISLLFSSLTLCFYLSLQLSHTLVAGPFYAVLPLPLCVLYFWRLCEAKFKHPSTTLTLEFSKEMDRRSVSLSLSSLPTATDTFTPELYRHPSLRERERERERNNEEEYMSSMKGGGREREKEREGRMRAMYSRDGFDEEREREAATVFERFEHRSISV
eukprot:CAMPEP_0182425518 /NCGR_PEP_ID=MMETSP1167-20130531/11955_1 /TAXON_ID=2988 /ORGANISM="Mallomonas Sp, Strain CCMP3275" /LENGTH=450 /DNA_ID=CAMNT_0024606317 /DNA_START=131 /DNA_END=1483 /DNA_ORIENTATION=-